LDLAPEGTLVMRERYPVQLPPGGGQEHMKVAANLARIAASDWTERTVH
jgi:hypothetical protein